MTSEITRSCEKSLGVATLIAACIGFRFMRCDCSMNCYAIVGN